MVAAKVVAARSGKRQETLGRKTSQLVGRLSWGLADQAVSSITNSIVAIYIAHQLGAELLGAFSIAYATYSFTLCASRGLAASPLTVRFSGVAVAKWREAVAICTGTAIVVGLILGACVLGVAFIFGGATRAALIALGITLPGLLLQDSWRYAFFAIGRGGHALLNDLIWAMAMLPVLPFLRTSHATIFYLQLVWGMAATVAAAFGIIQARIIPRPMGTRVWLARHMDLGYRYLIEFASSSVSVQLRTYSLGLILGLAVVGKVQACVTLMGPVTVAMLAMPLVLVPEAVEVLNRSPRRLSQLCVLTSAGLALVAAAWGVALLVWLPRGLGDLVLGPIWRPADPLVLPLTVAVVAQGLSVGAGAGLRALGVAQRSLRASAIGSVAALAFVAGGAGEAGAVGAMWGLAAAAWLAAVVWWWQLREAFSESESLAGRRIWSGRSVGKHRLCRSAGTRSQYKGRRANA